VVLPISKSKLKIAQVMNEAGYLSEVKTNKNEKGQENLVLTLKYVGDEPALTDLKRVSKPGRRIYVDVSKIPVVLHGYGLSILSTSHGIMAGTEAKQKGVGGEVVCEIW
jgi:small subunit ribosomal protein S8